MSERSRLKRTRFWPELSFARCGQGFYNEGMKRAIQPLSVISSGTFRAFLYCIGGMQDLNSMVAGLQKPLEKYRVLPYTENYAMPSNRHPHFRSKRMDAISRIELNPRICNGKPVIKGTRIPVSVILEQIAEGQAWDALLGDYPELTREDIQAALFYARSCLDHSEIRAVGA